MFELFFFFTKYIRHIEMNITNEIKYNDIILRHLKLHVCIHVDLCGRQKVIWVYWSVNRGLELFQKTFKIFMI